MVVDREQEVQAQAVFLFKLPQDQGLSLGLFQTVQLKAALAALAAVVVSASLHHHIMVPLIIIGLIQFLLTYMGDYEQIVYDYSTYYEVIMPYKNIEDKKKNSNEYYKKNKDRIKSYIKEWEKLNPEKVKLYAKRKRVSRKIRGAERIYYSNNKERIRENRKRFEKKSADKIKNRRLKEKYGITLDVYNDMLKKQNNSCAVCEVVFCKGIYPQVDHCHDTGKIRGLLCKRCNMLEGFLLKKDELIKKIEAYRNSFV